jgi:Co/Zn/Cd efflux system component
LVENQRAALALIAIITGVVACMQGVMSMRAGSTALLASALIFVQHSLSASIASWALSWPFARGRWIVQLQGLFMAVLGLLVFAAAIRRFLIGSVPHPVAMIILGALALGATMICGAIMLRQSAQVTSWGSVWRLTRTDGVSNVAVIAAAVTVALTRSNIPDLVIGAVMAVLFALAGLRMTISGQAADRRLP